MFAVDHSCQTPCTHNPIGSKGCGEAGAIGSPPAVINVRPVGVLKMEDDGGGDEKIIAVPSPKLTKRYLHVQNHTDLPQITLEQIRHFFEHYKDLEPGKWARILGWDGPAAARRMIREAIESASNPASAGSA